MVELGIRLSITTDQYNLIFEHQIIENKNNNKIVKTNSNSG